MSDISQKFVATIHMYRDRVPYKDRISHWEMIENCIKSVVSLNSPSYSYRGLHVKVRSCPFSGESLL